MYRLYVLVSEKAAHGNNASIPFSFSKQIMLLYREDRVAKQALLQGW
jgi:hypothetical protein